MKTVYIYTLSDPRTNEVRYVGKTNNPEQRRKAHGVLSREVKSRKKNWIKQLKRLDLRPVFEIIDEVPESEWHKWEKYWIQQFIVWGFRLTNHTAGGDGLTSGNQTSFRSGQIPWNKGRKKERPKRLPRGTPDNCKKNWFNKGHEPWNKGMKGLSLKPKKNVHQYDPYTGEFIKTWVTARAASIELGIGEDAISSCCRGLSKSSGRYVWRYELKDKIEVVKNNKLKIK